MSADSIVRTCPLPQKDGKIQMSGVKLEDCGVQRLLHEAQGNSKSGETDDEEDVVEGE